MYLQILRRCNFGCLSYFFYSLFFEIPICHNVEGFISTIFEDLILSLSLYILDFFCKYLFFLLFTISTLVASA